MIGNILSQIPGEVRLYLVAGTLGHAAFSAEIAGPDDFRSYRYLLYRPVVPDSADDAQAPARTPGAVLAFVMLNPSTATADKDDPTIAKCRRFARHWGFEHLLIANAYAWRSTDPKAMLRAAKRGEDIVGEYNDRVIEAVAAYAGVVVCAWGANITHDRCARVHGLIPEAKRHAIRITAKSRQPEHPLYLPEALRPGLWTHGVGWSTP